MSEQLLLRLPHRQFVFRWTQGNTPRTELQNAACTAASGISIGRVGSLGHPLINVRHIRLEGHRQQHHDAEAAAARFHTVPAEVLEVIDLARENARGWRKSGAPCIS